MNTLSSSLKNQFTEYAPEYYSAKKASNTDRASDIFEHLGFDSSGGDTVGSGSGRIVCDMEIVGYSGFVVKFACPDDQYDGITQNRNEIRIWEVANTDQQEYLVPVIESGPQAYWLVMPKGKDIGTMPYEWQQEVKEKLADLIWIEDLRNTNVVQLQGSPKICDYGF
jgi:hypothetical protein